jgi:hypothetical protein
VVVVAQTALLGLAAQLSKLNRAAFCSDVLHVQSDVLHDQSDVVRNHSYHCHLTA